MELCYPCSKSTEFVRKIKVKIKFGAPSGGGGGRKVLENLNLLTGVKYDKKFINYAFVLTVIYGDYGQV